ncbi:AraC family transcriptional regulator [Cohnella nanjingensis]|uniref:Helix-turn-helix transcriptional regulator n=1 Tax=Cohnella nanjingensis TaxID=1387779 RepID=A0A7X0VEN7_9BACL|nr:AraC family transcriptional regulator [Cohnella nanjingensis]MBB6671200.1 helix-turn-helix transcriptional regulator [Cohnella nanjingensis]
MEFTQQELNHKNAILNDYAANLNGSDLSFYVHYWGGERKLYTNHVHKHSFFEICYVLDGEGAYEEGANRLPIGPGTLFMSRPHLKHQIVSEDGLYIVFVAFELIPSDSSEEGVRRFQSLEKSRVFLLQNAQALPAVLMWLALLKQTEVAQRFFDDGVLGLACALLTSFENAFSDQRGPARTVPVQPSASTLVHRAKLYIRDNLAQELKLSSVADYLHVSPRHLSRLFGEELGQSYSTYVRRERIRQAVTLLTTTEWSIKRIAEETGFDTVHYFTTVFKSEMGEPPGQFLKKLREHTDMF